MVCAHDDRKVISESLRRTYRSQPDAYAADVLKVHWTEPVIELAYDLLEGNVCCGAGHGVGKTHFGGGWVNYHIDCWGSDNITLWTAPTQNHVEKVLGKEVRAQRRKRRGMMPQAPLIWFNERHYAQGITAASGEGFQGVHAETVHILYDESVGIKPIYFESGNTMIKGPHSRKILLYNRTNSSSSAYVEEMSGEYKVVTLSVVDHPNIKAELAGKQVPYPAAVRIDFIDRMVKRHCERILPDQATAESFSWPTLTEGGKRRILWYKPNSQFESRVLGRWPTQPASALWSDALFEACVKNRRPLQRHQPITIGVDCAGKGDNDTAFVVRQGVSVVHAEWFNGWLEDTILDYAIFLAHEYCHPGDDPCEIPIYVDDTGLGGGVVAFGRRRGYTVIGVNAATKARGAYPNRRSELWFTTRDAAQKKEIDFSRLSEEPRSRLRRELLAPTWRDDNQARRIVEPKEATKKRLGSSPDLADAFNLAFSESVTGTILTASSALADELAREALTW